MRVWLTPLENRRCSAGKSDGQRFYEFGWDRNLDDIDTDLYDIEDGDASRFGDAAVKSAHNPRVAFSVMQREVSSASTSWPTTSLEKSVSWATTICAEGAMRTTDKSLAALMPTRCSGSVLQ